jgi:FKBP-type peptidyl-prolyl cis-trans isomerase FkpA
MPFEQAGPEGKEVTTSSGLQYIDLKVGTGATARAGQNVTVHYTGWLENGTKFDSSVDRGQPFSFPLGAGRVIKGWDEGVQGMMVGGKRKLTLPSSLGYGARGAGSAIPPNATLIFEVELLGV